MPTTGVVGHRWRADVTATGAIEPWDGSPTLDWHVAADDRWHDPRADSGVRQQRVSGAAVFETRVRIPGGDAVQRVWSVADRGGYTLVEVHNDSSLPIACAFTRPDVVASRPPASVPIEGVDVPAGSVLLPIGHRATVVVGLAHAAAGSATLPGGLAGSDAVARGWTARADAASRLDLSDVGLVDAVRAARCEAALNGPGDRVADPERWLLTVGELTRMSELDERAVGAIAPDVAEAVHIVAAGSSPLARAALDAAGVVLARAGERRALDDLAKIIARNPTHEHNDITGRAPERIEIVAAVERTIASGGVLFPGGIPSPWRGADFEAHRLAVGPSSRLSLAVRWHGAHAAVLWEIDGDPVTLTSPVVRGGWTSTAAAGEALWVLDPVASVSA